MLHELERRCRRGVLGLVAWSCCGAGAVFADEGGPGVGMPLLDASRDLLRNEHPLRARDYGNAPFVVSDERRAPARQRVDLSPALDEIFGFFHRHGVPLREQVDDEGHGPIGVYANFSVGRDVPAVSFHLGDRSMEPIGAFYSSERGFRCAVVWPINRFTLRLEGGDDSELGYYGIAGMQWVDPRRPIAIGIGVPMNLVGAHGGVGFVIQLRMTLN